LTKTRKTVTYLVCDGLNDRQCGKVLTSVRDGIRIKGTVYPTGEQTANPSPVVGDETPESEVVLCGECLAKLVQLTKPTQLVSDSRDNVSGALSSAIDWDRSSGPLLPPELQ